MVVIGIVAAALGSGAKTPSTHVGLGSTIAAMASEHGADHGPGAVCTAANACFGASLTNDESGHTYQFTDVSTGGGLIMLYQQNFVRGTSEESALSLDPPRKIRV